MGGKRSRSKGSRGEREVITIISEVVNREYLAAKLEPPAIERNLMQSRRGGYDVIGIDWLALEVKYQEQFQLDAWWAQCKDQAREDQEPVLFYRRNRVPWRVRMFGYLMAPRSRVRCPVDISVEAFCAFLQTRLLVDIFDR